MRDDRNVVTAADAAAVGPMRVDVRRLYPQSPGERELRLSRPFFSVSIAFAACLFGGCAAAPVQEMSNARQAIRAARDAGAAQIAPQKLTEAEGLLERAQLNLQQRAYRNARQNAVNARTRANEALLASQPIAARDNR